MYNIIHISNDIHIYIYHILYNIVCHFSLLRLSPVQDWEDSHQAIAVKREGIGEEDAKVSLKN